MIKKYSKKNSKKGGSLLKNLFYRFGLQNSGCKCCTWTPDNWMKLLKK